MSEVAPLYPPNPTNVPKDFTEPNWSYCTRVLLVLGSLIVFVAVYLGMVVGSAYLCYASFMALKGLASPAKNVVRGPADRYPKAAPAARPPRVQFPALYILVSATSGLVFLFLLKGFFKFRHVGKPLDVEITEKDQPAFFAFLRRLCKDTGAAMPHRVFLTPDVNAMVTYDNPMRSLFLPTKKNLVVGLGLVNHLNLTEFKAVLAHEFGHFAQSSMKLGTYVFQVNRLISDMVYGRDYFDDMIERLKHGDPRIALFAGAFSAILWCLRKGLEGLFQAINFANSALSRQMEFNADLVAVTVTGSDALVQALARIEIADQTLEHALTDLVAAGDHQLYTRDLFVHQTRALDYLRQEKKDPKFGTLAALPEDVSRTNKVFKPGDTGIPLMWATHPSNYDREQNAKYVYLRCAIDERPAWELFAPEARERVTTKFFSFHHKVPADKLSDPAKVQAFIDAEHAETTYPARFLGMYDDRFLNLADVETWVTTPPEFRDRAYLAQRHAQLYGPHIQVLMRQIDERIKDCGVLQDLLTGKRAIDGKTFTFRGSSYSAFDVADLLASLQHELEAERKRLGDEDRTVFQVHHAMAQQVNDLLPHELIARYRFHAGVQEILHKSSTVLSEMNDILEELSGKRELSEDYFRDIVHFFQEMHRTLKTSLDAANRLRIPRLENMEDGKVLGEFLLTEPLISYLSNSVPALDGKWLDRLAKQTTEIVDRSRRIHFKSLGGIFALQDKIAAKWAERGAAAAGERETVTVSRTTEVVHA